jgi:D-glycero-alpha-D-manno-heptose-7-phosphate kinase
MNPVTNARLAHASAPLRVDLAGGWTDVPPFSAREGGLVVNAAIGLYAHATVDPVGDGITLISHDLGDRLRVGSLEELRVNGRLALLQAAVRMFPLFPCELTSRSEAPAGSGLGSSGAIDVALVSALTLARAETLDPSQTALTAWRLEVEEAGMPGGKQDQFAAALGGVRALRFQDPVVDTERIELDPAFADHLERNMVLCYTGTSRVSGAMISRVMQGYEKGDPAITGALRGMKEVAAGMVEALRTSDLERVGALLDENWNHQCRLDPGMRTDDMARLERAVIEAGILGGKAAGAGAGGCMFFLARSDAPAVADAARRAGAQVLPFRWVAKGVRAW